MISSWQENRKSQSHMCWPLIIT